MHGIETTRAAIPLAASSSRAPSATSTSEPVATIAASSPGATTVAPRLTSSTAGSRTGRPWRDSTITVGPGWAMRCGPGLGALVGIGRADHADPGHGAQAGQVLDRLVGRPVLAEADRIVGEHEHDRQLHQRGEADRLQHVVPEREEGRAERPKAAVRGHAVADRAHGVLADPEVDVAPGPVAAVDVARAADHGMGRGDHVRRAADQLRHLGAERIERLARRDAGRDARAGLEGGQGVPPPLAAAAPRSCARTRPPAPDASAR